MPSVLNHCKSEVWWHTLPKVICIGSETPCTILQKEIGSPDSVFLRL